MKKKILSILLASLLVFSLSACGNQEGEETESSTGEEQTQESTQEQGEPAASGKKQEWNFATGGTTGTYYAYGGVLANILNEKVPEINLTVQSTGASKANIFSLADNEAQIALVQNDTMHYASRGEDLFQGEEPIKSFSTIAALYPETCQIIAVPGIKTVADLKGKNVSVGDAGSGTEFNAIQILAAYGLDADKDIKKQNLSFGDSAEALKDGKIDAAFIVAGTPTTAVTELATTNDISLVSIDKEHADQLKKDYPFYAEMVVPGGTYKGVDEDVSTVAVKATLICRSDLPEDAVYALTKALFENKDDIAAAHAKGELIDPAYAVESVSVPFHPGAEKYLKEIGALK